MAQIRGHTAIGYERKRERNTWLTLGKMNTRHGLYTEGAFLSQIDRKERVDEREQNKADYRTS